MCPIKVRLRKHVEAEHKDVKHSCDQCDMVFTFGLELKKHCREIHKGRRYYCSICDYSANHSVRNHINGIIL